MDEVQISWGTTILNDMNGLNEQQTKDRLACVRRHVRFGWWSLLCFLSLGITLELLHAFKISWYLESAYTTRRLMWTLAHSHGTVLALVHIAFAASIFFVPGELGRGRRFASPCLMAASLLLPGGFFLGGVFIYDGDPGVGVFLVPVGGFVLLVGVFLTAWETAARTSVSDVADP